MSKVSAIVVAAGSSTRMGKELTTSKLLLQLKNSRTVIENSLACLSQDKRVSFLTLVVQTSEIDAYKRMFCSNPNFESIEVVPGGASRTESVKNGLASLAKNGRSRPKDLVLIHDGARPLVKKKDLETLIDSTKEKQAAILARPLTSTIKYCSNSNFIIEKTIERKYLFEALTPQCFEFHLIEKSYNQSFNNLAPTDDSELIENLKWPVSLVTTEFPTPKITFMDDIKVVNSFLDDFSSLRFY